MNKYLKTLLFFILLFLANLYLLKDGFWFYQDAGYWPKTGQEMIIMLQQQFYSFTTYGYFIGFDQGLFNFTRIVVTLFQTLIFFLFGHSGSQIAFSFFGSILTFFSFYLFSGLFFSNKNLRYVLCLIYTFSPLTYALQGHTFYHAVSPLFIYSFHQYFYEQKKLRLSYLILNIIAGFLWISYIRFFQSNLFIIAPYIVYLFFINKKNFLLKRALLLIFSYVLIFAPVIYSVTAQFLERSQTAFNYGAILGKSVAKHNMVDAFNIFQSVGTKLYEGSIWTILGIIFFSSFLILLITYPRQKRSAFFLLNLALVLFAITIYSLGNIYDGELFSRMALILFPFTTNEPLWAFYVLALPGTILMGILAKERIKYLYIYSGLFIIVAILPLINISDFQLQKYNLLNIPTPYLEYFIKPYNGVPEATHYIPGACWRAKYMNEANTPTLCPNYGLRYIPILIDNPRLASGDTFELSNRLNSSTTVGNLRITHNLKNVIVANDIVKTKGPGPITGGKEIEKIKSAKTILDNNQDLDVIRNKNFNHYFFKDKDDYDFTIYSPKSVVYKDIADIDDGTLDINDAPVVLKKEKMIDIPQKINSASVFYKISPNNPTKYDLKITGVDQSEPFIIQFNKAYGGWWKLKIVDEETFNKLSCTGKLTQYKITNNQMCQYDNNIFDWESIKLLSSPEIKSENHFVGNFLSNGWVVRPEEIPSEFKDKKNLHFVIIYEKQIYYIYTILITGMFLAVLVAASVYQETKNLMSKKNK